VYFNLFLHSLLGFNTLLCNVSLTTIGSFQCYPYSHWPSTAHWLRELLTLYVLLSTIGSFWCYLYSHWLSHVNLLRELLTLYVSLTTIGSFQCYLYSHWLSHVYLLRELLTTEFVHLCHLLGQTLGRLETLRVQNHLSNQGWKCHIKTLVRRRLWQMYYRRADVKLQNPNLLLRGLIILKWKHFFPVKIFFFQPGKQNSHVRYNKKNSYKKDFFHKYKKWNFKYWKVGITICKFKIPTKYFKGNFFSLKLDHMSTKMSSSFQPRNFVPTNLNNFTVSVL